MSEVSMWLFPVAISALIALVFCFRFKIQWAWGLILQQSLILAASLIGFYYLYPLPFTGRITVDEASAAGWCWAAWTLFLVFNIGQRVVLTKITSDLVTLKVSFIRKQKWLIHLVSWGPPGRFWVDMADAVHLYAEKKPAQAEQIFYNWREKPYLPGQAKETLIAYQMNGEVLLANWQHVIELFQYAQRVGFDTSPTISVMASRAYGEEAQFPESLACVMREHGRLWRLPASWFDTVFMTFFALAGALEQLDEVFSVAQDKRDLPQSLRTFWRGRCLVVRGQYDEAVKVLKQAQSETPKALAAWHRRIQARIETVEALVAQGGPAVENKIASQSLVAQAAAFYKKRRLIAELIRPQSSKRGLISLCAILMLAYVITNPDQFVLVRIQPEKYIAYNKSLIEFHNSCYLWGELDPKKLWAGQWWRLISYMFLHGNTAHLLLNCGALFLFGRSVENIYSTRNFLFLFFGAGILSGLGQAILQPTEAAIGASGAILGIFGAAMAAMIRLKWILPRAVRLGELKWMVAVALLQVVFDQLINHLAAGGAGDNGIRIAAFAHIGGIVAGFLLGLVVAPRGAQMQV